MGFWAILVQFGLLGNVLGYSLLDEDGTAWNSMEQMFGEGVLTVKGGHWDHVLC